MNMEHRVDNLEQRAKWRIDASDPKNLRLFDAIGNDVEGEIIQMPTPEADGLARLPDGAEKAIAYEHGWETQSIIGAEPGLKARWGDSIHEVVIDDTADHKLRIRRSNAVAFIGVDLGKFPDPLMQNDGDLREYQKTLSQCLRNKPE